MRHSSTVPVCIQVLITGKISQAVVIAAAAYRTEAEFRERTGIQQSKLIVDEFHTNTHVSFSHLLPLTSMNFWAFQVSRFFLLPFCFVGQSPGRSPMFQHVPCVVCLAYTRHGHHTYLPCVTATLTEAPEACKKKKKTKQACTINCAQHVMVHRSCCDCSTAVMLFVVSAALSCQHQAVL